ncbi:MAG: Rid family hydrolase [Betaproteobacteria bacterium]
MSVAWRMVERGRMAWVSALAPEPIGDARAQAARALERIDALLGQAGYDKARFLTARISVPDQRLLQDVNAAWDDWVDPSSPPLRVNRTENLDRPGALVHILVTAAK